MSIDIELILDELKQGKSPRTQSSLEKLNDILKAYHVGGGRDYSITQIGRVSEAKGGVGYRSLRNTNNIHYRSLIEAWAAKAGTTTKKPIQESGRPKGPTEDNRLLQRINDPALRAHFGHVIAQRNRCMRDLKLLKSQADIVIDRRPQHVQAASEVEVLPAFSGILTDMEKSALAYAITDECMEKQGWEVTRAGQVKGEHGEEIYPRGYANAIKKILQQVDGDGE
jgi:hypothetical protein